MIFENRSLRIQSVSVAAKNEEPYHDHRYPSVLVVDKAPPEIDRNRSGQEFDLSPFSAFAPYVLVQQPEGLHSVKNLGATPDDLIRIEFKRGLQ